MLATSVFQYYIHNYIYSSVLFTSITLFACVFYLLWEAMLISYLSSRTIILPFKTIDDLMQKTDLKIVVQPYSAQMDFFRYSTVPILRMAYAERIKPELPFYVEYFQNAGEHFFFIKKDKCYNNFFAENFAQFDLLTESDDYSVFEDSHAIR